MRRNVYADEIKKAVDINSTQRFIERDVLVSMNTQKQISFHTEGNTNIFFKVLSSESAESVAEIVEVSKDKQNITIKGLNEGCAVLQAFSLDTENHEQFLDSCIISVSFETSAVNPAFSKGTYSLIEGFTDSFSFTSDMEKLQVVFEIENHDIAEVNQMQITGKKPGYTKICAKYKDKVIAEADVVISAYSEDVQIVCHDLELVLGQTARPLEYVSIIPTSEKDKLEYDVQNPDVCMYDQVKKELRAVGVGSTTVIVKHPSNVFSLLKVQVKKNSTAADRVTIGSSKYEYKLMKDETIGLDLSVTPATELKNIKLIPLDERICKVDSEKKLITALNAGETYVRVIHPLAGEFRVKICVYEKTDIRIPNSIELKMGEKQRINTSVTPITEERNITYLTNDPKVCGVSNDGYITGVAEGRTKVIVLYKGVEYGRIAVKVMKQESNLTGTAKYVIVNTLDKRGDLSVPIGSTITLDVDIQNADKSIEKRKNSPRIRILSGKKYIDVTDTKNDFKFNLTGNKKGEAVIEIYGQNSKIKPIKINVKVDYYDTKTEDIKISSSTIIQNDTILKNAKDRQMTRIEMGTKAQLQVSGYSNINLTKHFDTYFRIEIYGDSVKYSDDGVIKAVRPGISKVVVKSRETGKALGDIWYDVPFPSDYFMEYPSGMTIPRNKTIDVIFNNYLKAATVTDTSIFITPDGNGNGNNLNIKATVIGKKLSIELKEKDVKPGKYYIFLTDEVCDIEGNEIITPIKIPIVISD